MTKNTTTTGPQSSTATGSRSKSTRTSCFLSCFGCLGKKTQLTNKVNSGSQRHNRSFRFKKPATKTVPVEENATSTVKLASPEQGTVTITRSFVSSPLEPLTRSESLPSIKRLKPPHAGGDDVEVDRKKLLGGGEFDFIMGMSIILVILGIMVLWGKLCAIVCTCAWFFVVRRLAAAGGARERAVIDTVGKGKLPLESGDKLDLESEEYKKKVVLEGLLQRSRRNLVGRSVGTSTVNLDHRSFFVKILTITTPPPPPSHPPPQQNPLSSGNAIFETHTHKTTTTNRSPLPIIHR
ncbi:hypothetical protein QVD17_03845 [Tagetes erecta]|uniref:Transmembrane protein n=1 Tax=Tagetes erecta TaxID=13708 RepID=A0AAD8L917_TARER|nr:hypothetical protein QVD17_03845 [Tagetes erecta]